MLWGTLGIFGKSLYARGLTPMEVASVRAAVGLVGLALWFAPRPRRLRVRARDLPLLIAYGVIGYAVFETLFFSALARSPVAIAAALLYTAPAFVLIFGWITGDEPFRVARLLPLGLVLAGVFLVTGAARTLLVGATSLSPLALALGLASGLMYALFTWFGKRAAARHRPTPLIFYVFLFATLALAIPAPPWRVAAAHPDAVPLLVLLGLVPTLGAYVLYATALHHLPASTASMLASVEPVVAGLLGFSLLGEALSWDRMLGIGLVVAAAALLARGEHQSTTAPADAVPVAADAPGHAH